MNVLLIGSGGREHALAWKLAQSPRLDTLYVAPGNPGMAAHATRVALDPADHDAVVAFCGRHAIAFVVIGPEAPLVAGLADRLRAERIGVFGPNREAAQLEGSKGFTKDLCARAGIPTARYVRVASPDAAREALAGFTLPVVLKADGLAAGKGVIIATTPDEADAAIVTLMAEPCAELVIEAFLTGEEASLFVLTDGTHLMPFGSAQDHKRVGEGDTGPNTGGMGAYSPAAVLTPELMQRALDEIVRPTIDTLRRDGMPYSGVLYAGLMLTDGGPMLIEYNCRFGDPETQVLMMRLEDDLLELMLATDAGTLGDHAPARFADEAALTVVMAASGYPGPVAPGAPIAGIEAAEATGARVFHAGTRLADDRLVASGGRVLNVTATGPSVAAAQTAAYRAVDRIDFPGGFCRRDIGWREVARG
ncbi:MULTISPECIES: phosphoribosylamine--glycine ligase [unclassified Sphingomonas]|jgi:phosphoribosylamine--glycine ligase|uniref:phosphoribosylamine--glycine ligase n=2 Tax=Sphingomonas TaxID=13687 RepID=UPI0008376323|nr:MULTISPECIES: phosphoribosylamine--glycine ligase [unclassified Sphingomonas]